MAGYRVEFVDPEPPPVTRAAEPGRSRVTAVRASVVPVLWIAGAALCVLSSFQTIFTYHFTGASIRSRGGFDAWGHALDRQLNGEHGPRVALLLWVCAALFALLAATLLPGKVANRAVRWALRHAAAIGLAAVALLTGTLASVGLGIESSFSSYHALSDTLQDGGGVDLSIGGCLWLGLASLACAVAALVLRAWAQPGTADAQVAQW